VRHAACPLPAKDPAAAWPPQAVRSWQQTLQCWCKSTSIQQFAHPQLACPQCMLHCLLCGRAAPLYALQSACPAEVSGWPTRQPSRDGPGCKSARPAPSSAVRTTNTLQLIASWWRVSGCSARSLARVLGHPSTPGHTVDHSFRTPITSKLYKAHTAVTPSVL